MNKNILIIVVVLVLLAGGAYWLMYNKTPDVSTPVDTGQTPVNPRENPQPGSSANDSPTEPAVLAARKDLATKLSVDEKSILIVKVTETTWTDGCLGLGGPAESCLQALVPGFKVEMLAKGKTYFYRTDKTGATIRLETEQDGVPTS